MESYANESTVDNSRQQNRQSGASTPKKKTNILMEFVGRGDNLTTYPSTKAVLKEIKAYRKRD